MNITLSCFEKLPEGIIKSIKGSIERKFDAKVDLKRELFLPPSTIRVEQIDARSFIAPVVGWAEGSYGLGITQKDIYVEGKDFVLGLSAPEVKAGIVSLFRIGSRSRVALEAKAIKLAIHELGHIIYGLNHCSNRRCVMHHETEDVKELDIKSDSFCKECLEKIQKAELLIKKEEESKNFFTEVKELWKRRNIKVE